MNVLIVCATKNEIEPLCAKTSACQTDDDYFLFENDKHNITILISGIGIASTTYKLTRCLNKKKYDIAINTGIAGTFNRNLRIGQLANISTDLFADLGIETQNGRKTIFETGLCDSETFPFRKGVLHADFDNTPFFNAIINLKNATAITVNTTSGTLDTINEFEQRFHPDIESMEGAAVFYVCRQENVKCAQIRAISNKVELRNKANWNIPLAVRNLNNFLYGLFY